MKSNEEPKKTFEKFKSDNYSNGEMFNILFRGDFRNVKQYVDNIVQQVHVQAPSPETEIEQLTKSLQTKFSKNEEYYGDYKAVIFIGRSFFIRKQHFYYGVTFGSTILI